MPQVRSAGYDFKLLIHENELDNLAGWVLEHPDGETGGDLFGFWTHSGAPSVQFVLGPGRHARHERAAFFQDAGYLQHAGEHVQTRYGLQHIGDWHSHHQMGLAAPSSGDAATARRVFDTTDFSQFLLFIANIGPEREREEPARSHRRGHPAGWEVALGAFLFRRGEPHYRKGRWVVLPGVSPVAESARHDGVAGGPHSPLRAWRVAETTLDSSIGETRAPVTGWYTTRWGAAFLREFDARCRASFANTGMSLDSGNRELIYSLRVAGEEISVVFPSEFPESVATLVSNGAVTEVCVDVGHEPATRDADRVFEQLSAWLRPKREVVVTESEIAGRDVALKEPVDGVAHKEPAERVEGMEFVPAEAAGTGAGDPGALLSLTEVALPGPALEDAAPGADND